MLLVLLQIYWKTQVHQEYNPYPGMEKPENTENKVQE